MLDCPEEILYNPRSAGPLAQWLEQATHNRLVAGSNPAGATIFSDENHAVKPTFRVGFFVSSSQLSPFCPLRFSYLPAEQMKLKMPNPHIRKAHTFVKDCQCPLYPVKPAFPSRCFDV